MLVQFLPILSVVSCQLRNRTGKDWIIISQLRALPTHFALPLNMRPKAASCLDPEQFICSLAVRERCWAGLASGRAWFPSEPFLARQNQAYRGRPTTPSPNPGTAHRMEHSCCEAIFFGSICTRRAGVVTPPTFLRYRTGGRFFKKVLL